MNILRSILAPALAVALAAQVSAAPILVGEFTPANSGDATEHAAIRDAITAYNALPAADLSQLFNTATPPALINGWSVFVAKTTTLTGFTSGGQNLTFTAPGTFAEYYVFGKFGQGQGAFDSSLHHLLSGDALNYNPGGDGPPNGLSHLAIWARGTSVPDAGSTLSLLGASLLALALLKRRITR